ncbi:MAG: class I SAM-dependent methyltransferase [Phycisphaerae bacterium]|nr:class I SAM-dependent methyltransferase [Phycisphaerae bacterium]
MNPVLQEILATGQVNPGNGQPSVSIRSGILPAEGAYLQQIIRDIDARVTLEVGLAFGVSALFICDAVPPTSESRHYVMDPHQHKQAWRGLGVLNLERAGFMDRVSFHEQPAHAVLPQLEEQGLRVDFAFIDGRHMFDYALVDFFLIDRLLRVGGVVAFDDACWESVWKVVRFVIRNRAYRVYGELPMHTSKRSLAGRLAAAAASSGRWFQYVWSDWKARAQHQGRTLRRTRCIALVKEADDTRPMRHFVPF